MYGKDCIISSCWRSDIPRPSQLRCGLKAFLAETVDISSCARSSLKKKAFVPVESQPTNRYPFFIPRDSSALIDAPAKKPLGCAANLSKLSE